MKSEQSLVKVTHYGTVNFGPAVECEALVLATGERGFGRRQVMQLVGFHQNTESHRFRAFLAEIAPKALNLIGKKESQVLMPSGQRVNFVPCDVIPEFASGVIRQALTGKLHTQRQSLVEPCLAIQESLSKVGITALIDEATGYQYHRAPDALQDLFAKLIRQTAADWERRFHPDYYEAIYRLFKLTYDPAKPKPNVVGQITLQWVYEPVFPAEILVEIKERQQSEKIHQWLADGGLHLLEKQRDAVMMIARSSTDYQDFKARCSVAFFRRGQISILFPVVGVAP